MFDRWKSLRFARLMPKGIVTERGASREYENERTWERRFICRQNTQIEEDEMCFSTCVSVTRAQLLDRVWTEISTQYLIDIWGWCGQQITSHIGRRAAIWLTLWNGLNTYCAVCRNSRSCLRKLLYLMMMNEGKQVSHTYWDCTVVRSEPTNV